MSDTSCTQKAIINKDNFSLLLQYRHDFYKLLCISSIYWVKKKSGYGYDCMNDCTNVLPTLSEMLQYYPVVLLFGFYFSCVIINSLLNSMNYLKNKTSSYRSFIILNEYLKAVTYASLFWLHNAVKVDEALQPLNIVWLPEMETE